MANSWIKKMNAIPKQIKTPVDRLTSQEWNSAINILAEQSNNNTSGIDLSLRLTYELKRFVDEEYDKKLKEIDQRIKDLQLEDSYNSSWSFIKTIIGGSTNSIYAESFGLLQSYDSEEGDYGFVAEIVRNNLNHISEIKKIEMYQYKNETWTYIEELGIASIYQKLKGEINELRDISLDHDRTTLESRSKPNQHPIKSIIGLKPKVEVYIGSEEPLSAVDTWFDLESEGENEVPIVVNWEPLSYTPNIFINAVISCNAFSISEPIRFVVIGSVEGQIFRQELHSDVNGIIEGEIVWYISNDYTQVTSFNIRLEPVAEENKYVVSVFENTGNLNQENFLALRIEVYR